MRFSDAMLLGQSVVKPKAGQQYDLEEESGCALGMAVIGSGRNYQRRQRGDKTSRGRTGGGLESVPDWEFLIARFPRPCDCWRFNWRLRILPQTMVAKDIIAHLFDVHVMEKNDWTMERLAAWLRTIEPGDMEGVPLEFAPGMSQTLSPKDLA